MIALVFRILVTEASAGIDNLNPVVVTFEQSWTEGKTWESVPYSFESIEGDGEWEGTPASTTPRLAPMGRLKIVLPAGESAIFEVFKPKLDMRDVYAYTSSDLSVTSSLGLLVDGVSEDIKINTVTPADNVPMPVSLHGGQGEPELAITLEQSVEYVETESERLALPVVSVITAFDTETNLRKELKVSSDGSLLTKPEPSSFKRTVTDYKDYSVTPISGEVTESIVLPADFRASKVQVFDSSGTHYELRSLANSDLKVFVPPGGVETEIQIDEGDTLQIYHAATLDDKTEGFRTLTIYGKTV